MKKKLAWFDKPNMKGTIRYHPQTRKNPRVYKGVKVHMETAQRVMKKTGNRKQAIQAGLDAEHRGKSPRQVSTYELECARIAKRIKEDK